MRPSLIVAFLVFVAGCETLWKPETGPPVGPLVPVPLLRQPLSPTRETEIEIRGATLQGVLVEIYVNGSLAGITTADPQGEFRMDRVPLEVGRNRISAVVEDRNGNRSESGPPGGADPDGVTAVFRPEVVVVRRP